MSRPSHLTGSAGDGNTPLDPDDLEGLIPDWIATQGELDAAEFDNVRAGQDWAQSQLPRRDVLDEAFLRELHVRLFGKVWKWAGRYRTSEKNIGVPPHQIVTALRNLIDGVRYWEGNGTYAVEERGARLHHRLVAIHPFANGNGRVSRELADLYLQSRGAARFAWGASLESIAVARDRYLAALRSADAGDLRPLIELVRS